MTQGQYDSSDSEGQFDLGSICLWVNLLLNQSETTEHGFPWLKLLRDSMGTQPAQRFGIEGL